MKITIWGLCAPHLEIYYIMEADLSLDEKTTVEHLGVFLQPALKQRKIKLIKLKCAPQYKATNGPGSKVAKNSNSDGMPGVMSRVGSLGAFVNVQGNEQDLVSSLASSRE